MDVDVDVVDLSITPVIERSGVGNGSGEKDVDTLTRDIRSLARNSNITITPSQPNAAPFAAEAQIFNEQRTNFRVLRPRTEQKSYAEAPDIAFMPAKGSRSAHNGNIDSESEDEEMPPFVPMKELSAAEIWERERNLRKLRDELRNEETKLVLLKKIKQSQQLLKENIIVTPSVAPLPTSVMTKGSLTLTPTTLPATAPPAHLKNRTPSISMSRSTHGAMPMLPTRSSLPGGAVLTAGGSPNRGGMNQSRTGSNLSITPSVTITPTSATGMSGKHRNHPISNINSVSITASHVPNSDQITKSTERQQSREETQTPAQRQAAAKLALRKQLEKTLLQIPPPKPPPPELHFIPNPSNTEFVYLLGLEHVVDYITKDKKMSPFNQPFRCGQCKIDFTPVWKWEKQGKTGNATFQNTPASKDPKVICEQCVTTNVKKALKAEHTNRLKTAFVKALQQEQEIEQRLATQGSMSPIDSPAPISTPIPVPVQPPQLSITKAVTPQPRPTPPPPPPASPAPSPTVSRSRQNMSSVSQDTINNAAAAAQLNAMANLGNLGNLGGNVNASLLQAFHQQVFRGLQGLGNSSANAQAQAQAQAHMMQFNPLLYSYQLSMAHQALASAGKNLNVNEIQRLAEMQRQYLMDIIPQQQQSNSNSNNRQNNWKT
ncbi:transcriptional repressor p66-beta-like isoform X2 [Bradysia coprophila]|uniref:transcriptional repressor p66-beta-like isoform X2 n=1 Tax=Bradysia coprophila TaxID=38358 RepID=UPI00187DD2EA|nr:transcriptional repressor p66-beta-like isoform X2 [Bradysia coprophila]